MVKNLVKSKKNAFQGFSIEFDFPIYVLHVYHVCVYSMYVYMYYVYVWYMYVCMYIASCTCICMYSFMYIYMAYGDIALVSSSSVPVNASNRSLCGCL